MLAFNSPEKHGTFLMGPHCRESTPKPAERCMKVTFSRGTGREMQQFSFRMVRSTMENARMVCRMGKVEDLFYFLSSFSSVIYLFQKFQKDSCWS